MQVIITVSSEGNLPACLARPWTTGVEECISMCNGRQDHQGAMADI